MVPCHCLSCLNAREPRLRQASNRHKCFNNVCRWENTFVPSFILPLLPLSPPTLHRECSLQKRVQLGSLGEGRFPLPVLQQINKRQSTKPVLLHPPHTTALAPRLYRGLFLSLPKAFAPTSKLLLTAPPPFSSSLFCPNHISDDSRADLWHTHYYCLFTPFDAPIVYKIISHLNLAKTSIFPSYFPEAPSFPPASSSGPPCNPSSPGL